MAQRRSSRTRRYGRFRHHRHARSVAGKHGLALLRLDRAAEARAKGEALLADGIALTVRKPEWATFDLESSASPASS